MATSAGPTVRFVEARKRFGPRGALAGVTLDAGPGVTAVVGPNGAGKTTLLSLALGFLRPSGGKLDIDGATPARWVRKWGAGYLPERVDLPGRWRVGPTLRDLARLSGADAPAEMAREAETRFGLGELRDRRTDRLSRGELQRLGLAQAALGRPRLLALDEPGQGLDPVGRRALNDWVVERSAAGATVLLSTHDAALAARLADRIIVLEKGAVRDVIAPAAVDRTPSSYSIELAEAHPLLGSWTGSDRPSALATISVEGPRDLARRLGELLEGGALISRVEPNGSPLEARLRQALEAAR
ncbi:MAG: ABC transporter ATP-binding protein [Gemmatimonadota bacterium]